MYCHFTVLVCVVCHASLSKKKVGLQSTGAVLHSLLSALLNNDIPQKSDRVYTGFYGYM